MTIIIAGIAGIAGVAGVMAVLHHCVWDRGFAASIRDQYGPKK